MTDGLIVNQPYADEIMDGVKTVEYRAKKLPDDKKFIDVYILSGGHILGTDAATLIQEVVVAMKAGLTVDILRKAVHIHPALSEVVQRAVNF